MDSLLLGRDVEEHQVVERLQDEEARGIVQEWLSLCHGSPLRGQRDTMHR